MTPLEQLAGGLRAAGGLLADAVVSDDETATPRLGAHATRRGEAVECGEDYGALAATRGGEYALVVEAIREGYLQHYGQGRVVRPEDPDLALLAGDRLYALGLARLAALGDVEAVAILADVISRSAQAHAEGEPARADAAWRMGAQALAAA